MANACNMMVVDMVPLGTRLDTHQEEERGGSVCPNGNVCVFAHGNITDCIYVAETVLRHAWA